MTKFPNLPYDQKMKKAKKRDWERDYLSQREIKFRGVQEALPSETWERGSSGI